MSLSDIYWNREDKGAVECIRIDGWGIELGPYQFNCGGGARDAFFHGGVILFRFIGDIR